jgi:zinc transporter 1/2/3
LIRCNLFAADLHFLVFFLSSEYRDILVDHSLLIDYYIVKRVAASGHIAAIASHTQRASNSAYNRIIMELSLALRVGTVFINFVASAAGVATPLYFDHDDDHRKSEKDWVRVVRCFAAGVMLGVAIIHLGKDGSETLGGIYEDYPALSNVLTTVGILIVIGCEQVALSLLHSSSPDESGHEGHHDLKSHQSSNHNGDIEISMVQEELEVVTSSKKRSRINDICEHSHGLGMVAGASSSTSIVKAYMMEFSVAVHSVIIGITQGSLSGEENLQALKSLMIAIALHQYVEGISLGAVMKSANLQLCKVLTFVLIFATSVSVGNMIGILVTESGKSTPGEEPVSQLWVQGVLDSIVAGILIYVALVQLAAEDFQAAELATRFGLKSLMFVAMATGIASMAILAMWA